MIFYSTIESDCGSINGKTLCKYMTFIVISGTKNYLHSEISQYREIRERGRRRSTRQKPKNASDQKI